MAHFITRDEDDLLDWDTLSEGIRIAPWAQPIVSQILAEPVGAWFMSVAAALEYMHNTPLHSRAQSADSDEALENVERGDQPETDEDREAREREEAGNAWMVEQGFDSKE